MLPWWFPVFFALLWVLVGNVLGLISGWWALASRYRHTGPFPGTLLRFRSGRLGCCGFGNVLTIGVNADGLYLRTFFLFRAGFPPILIPWSDVSAEEIRGWVRRYVVFRFAQISWTKLRLFASTGREVARLANRSWAEPAPGVE
jgi:hypothetical protein